MHGCVLNTVLDHMISTPEIVILQVNKKIIMHGCVLNTVLDHMISTPEIVILQEMQI